MDVRRQEHHHRLPKGGVIPPHGLPVDARKAVRNTPGRLFGVRTQSCCRVPPSVAFAATEPDLPPAGHGRGSPAHAARRRIGPKRHPGANARCTIPFKICLTPFCPEYLHISSQSFSFVGVIGLLDRCLSLQSDSRVLFQPIPLIGTSLYLNLCNLMDGDFSAKRDKRQSKLA